MAETEPQKDESTVRMIHASAASHTIQRGPIKFDSPVKMERSSEDLFTPDNGVSYDVNDNSNYFSKSRFYH